MSTPIQQFFKDHGVSEVEAVVPDMAGIARGKVMPAVKFAEDEGMRMPESIFLQTVTGEYPEDDRAINPSEIDIVLKADPTGASVRLVTWRASSWARRITPPSCASTAIPARASRSRWRMRMERSTSKRFMNSSRRRFRWSGPRTSSTFMTTRG